MHSNVISRNRTRRSGLRTVFTQPLFLTNIEEKEIDSGVDESSEDDMSSSKTIKNTTTIKNEQRTTSHNDKNTTMRAYDTEFASTLESLACHDLNNNGRQIIDNNSFEELDKNIERLEADIIRCCDQVIRSVEKRRDELLAYVQEIRAEKLNHLKEDCNKNYDIPMLQNTCHKKDIHLGSCLRFVMDDDLANTISEYGTIDEGRAAAKNSIAHGIGLKYCIAKESTQFELETFNISGEKSWVEQDKIEVLVNRGNKNYPCIIQNNCDGTYRVLYELQEPGQYEIHVYVNGRHITDSPFLCDVFEKCDLKFLYCDNKPDEWTFQNGDKSALVEKTEIRRTSKLYSNIFPPARAWKVRVTTACPKIKLRFGYSNTSSGIPDLYEEFYCKFNLNDLITSQPQLPYHHTQHNFRRSRSKTNHRERKQSTFHRSSLTFIIFQDVENNRIHAAVEGTTHTQTSEFTDEKGVTLVPFIGIKHFCKNASCPRPMLVFV